VHLFAWRGGGMFFRSHSLVFLSQDGGANVPPTYAGGGGGAVAQPPSASATSNAASGGRWLRSAGRFRCFGASRRCNPGVSMVPLQSRHLCIVRHDSGGKIGAGRYYSITVNAIRRAKIVAS
jgi:hypothetical protein